MWFAADVLHKTFNPRRLLTLSVGSGCDSVLAIFTRAPPFGCVSFFYPHLTKAVFVAEDDDESWREEECQARAYLNMLSEQTNVAYLFEAK